MSLSLTMFGETVVTSEGNRVRGSKGRRGGTHRRAGLNVELAHGLPVVHGVERRDLVDAHGGHLEEAGDLVHDADGGEAVLALAQVQQRHDGRLLVLGRVPLEDLGDDGLVLRSELEGDVGVVLGGVAVLGAVLVSKLPQAGDGQLVVNWSAGRPWTSAGIGWEFERRADVPLAEYR